MRYMGVSNALLSGAVTCPICAAKDDVSSNINEKFNAYNPDRFLTNISSFLDRNRRLPKIEIVIIAAMKMMLNI